MVVAFGFLSDLADEEVGAKAATQDLFENESSFEVIPQLLELHGFGVPTKVAENRHTWNWRPFAETSVWTSLGDCPSSDQRWQLTFGGGFSRGRSDSPSSNCPWVKERHLQSFASQVCGAQPDVTALSATSSVLQRSL